MNRAHFMAQLRDGLSGLHPTDIDEIVADYESHFADGAADGRTEPEVAAALGDPSRLARELRAEIGFKRWGSKRNPGNMLGRVLALAGLATIDLLFLLPILSFLFVMLLGWAAACLGCVIGGSFLLLNMLPLWPPVVRNDLMQALIHPPFIRATLTR